MGTCPCLPLQQPPPAASVGLQPQIRRQQNGVGISLLAIDDAALGHVVDYLAPLSSIAAVLRVSKTVRRCTLNNRECLQRWASLFAGKDLPPGLEAWAVCRWVSTASFEGTWHQQTLATRSADAYEFTFELRATDPSTDAMCISLANSQPTWPPPSPDPALKLRSYTGVGTFKPQGRWASEIPFNVHALSCGLHLSYNIEWRNAGNSCMDICAPISLLSTTTVGVPLPIGAKNSAPWRGHWKNYGCFEVFEHAFEQGEMLLVPT